MIVRSAAIASFLACTAHTPLFAQNISDPSQNVAAGPGAGVELWASTDSEKTSVVKLTGRALWKFDGPAKYQGIDIEHAWFSPPGHRTREQIRAYLDMAGDFGSKWNWSARVGTNGMTVIGSASVRALNWSREAFVEREIVETPRGVDEGIYYTLVGASLDLLSDRDDTLSAMGGVQKFTGRNARLHLRGTYVHVIKPNLGLSIQLRARYFHSTVPGEFDYYSPRDFVQLIPVVQMRRFDKNGWMYLVALGYGAQRATASHWQAARLADVRFESPRSSRMVQAFLELQFANNSLVSAAGNYNYVAGRLGLTGKF